MTDEHLSPATRDYLEKRREGRAPCRFRCSLGNGHDGPHSFQENEASSPAESREAEALRAVADIVKRHTHQEAWAMTRHAGKDPENDCLLCRALVAAGVLTLDDIGAGTRAAILQAASTSSAGAADGE